MYVRWSIQRRPLTFRYLVGKPKIKMVRFFGQWSAVMTAQIDRETPWQVTLIDTKVSDHVLPSISINYLQSLKFHRPGIINQYVLLRHESTRYDVDLSSLVGHSLSGMTGDLVQSVQANYSSSTETSSHCCRSSSPWGVLLLQANLPPISMRRD